MARLKFKLRFGSLGSAAWAECRRLGEDEKSHMVVAQSLHIVSTGPSMTANATTVAPLHVDYARPESLSLPTPIHRGKGTNYLADLLFVLRLMCFGLRHSVTALTHAFLSQTLESWTQSV